MVQQRVQILIKYVVCMGATTLLNNTQAVLFTVTGQNVCVQMYVSIIMYVCERGIEGYFFCGTLPWLFAFLSVKCMVCRNKNFSELL